jgi:uncharacterized protein YwqG
MGPFSIFKRKKKAATNTLPAVDRERLTAHLKATEKYAIEFTRQSSSKPIGMGASKIGGKPHLPQGFRWPYYEGTNCNKVKACRPLSFIAQINMAEVAALDSDKKLPPSGFLYFFYELDTMEWGLKPEDNGCARVFHYDVAADQLSVTNYPDDLSSDYYVPESAVVFSKTRSIPSFEEFNDSVSAYWEDYEYAAKENGIDIARYPDFKLLGYADLIQGSIQRECAMVESGFSSDDWKTMSESEKKEIHAKEDQRILLAQFGSISDSIMFGDCGSIYFYIRKEDLEKGCFDDVHLSLQCY